MKAKYLFLGIALGSFALQACENDDNLHSGNQVIDEVFAQMYPQASLIGWERKGTYSVVDFRSDGQESEAWFDQNGVWYMTETGLSFDALPNAIKDAFLAGEYASWSIDDIDMIERKEMETIYVIEVESGEQEFDLYYAADGTLVKVVENANDNDDNEHYLPTAISDDIKAYISSHYPQAKIVEIENEQGMIEVDIIDNVTHRELLFDTDGQWIHTCTEVFENTVPQIVINALRASDYASYTIDDIDYYETAAEGNYYYFDLESAMNEAELIITLDGNIKVVKISNE